MLEDILYSYLIEPRFLSRAAIFFLKLELSKAPHICLLETLSARPWTSEGPSSQMGQSILPGEIWSPNANGKVNAKFLRESLECYQGVSLIPGIYRQNEGKDGSLGLKVRLK